MEIAGRIKLISDIQTFDSGFRKREVVITTEEQYPQHILIELLGDRVDIINSFHVGDDVRVSINIRGREWVNPQGETKYFNSITGWRIEKLMSVSSGMGQENPSVAPYAQVSASPSVPTMQEEEDDDLPF
jgi:single-strand DNA-binding protein